MAAKWTTPEDWNEWTCWLQAGLHARSRWRLPLVAVGMLFAKGRCTVTTWLRAAGIGDDYTDYYYFIGSLGRKWTKPTTGVSSKGSRVVRGGSIDTRPAFLRSGLINAST